jgi:hypothetical protein
MQKLWIQAVSKCSQFPLCLNFFLTVKCWISGSLQLLKIGRNMRYSQSDMTTFSVSVVLRYVIIITPKKRNIFICCRHYFIVHSLKGLTLVLQKSYSKNFWRWSWVSLFLICVDCSFWDVVSTLQDWFGNAWTKCSEKIWISCLSGLSLRTFVPLWLVPTFLLCFNCIYVLEAIGFYLGCCQERYFIH